jgi:hypothetical protein
LRQVPYLNETSFEPCYTVYLTTNTTYQYLQVGNDNFLVTANLATGWWKSGSNKLQEMTEYSAFSYDDQARRQFEDRYDYYDYDTVTSHTSYGTTGGNYSGTYYGYTETAAVELYDGGSPVRGYQSIISNTGNTGNLTTVSGAYIRGSDWGGGIGERMSKIINMPVNNLTGVLLGHVESLSLDVPHSRILNVSITARVDQTSKLKFSTVIPPTLLSFNPKRDELLLDVTKVQYSEEPHVNFEMGASGQVTSTREQAATSPHTDVALVQGTNFHDINTTAKIYSAMEEAKLDNFGVEVATLQGRVTLRGSVINPGTKVGIGAIAINLVRLDNVDNQIEVKLPDGILPASPTTVPAVLPSAQSTN